ncbi:response regulator [Flavobacteriaceae bacterium KMM 6897]|nr:response regulator [Flavobacteriaceae bacterium KMM 6897]MEB8345391.1 response regulator [Flavobacteriaceae bacterium KMM 6898]
MNEILLIDDNYIDNFINKKIVAKENIADTITVMLSPIEALDYLANKKDRFPDLILLDIKMPQMDGFEFLIEFSKFPEFKKANCSIVMLSSSQNIMDIATAKKNPHVIDYLIKPLDPSKLNDLLKLLV